MQQHVHRGGPRLKYVEDRGQCGNARTGGPLHEAGSLRPHHRVSVPAFREDLLVVSNPAIG